MREHINAAEVLRYVNKVEHTVATAKNAAQAQTSRRSGDSDSFRKTGTNIGTSQQSQTDR